MSYKCNYAFYKNIVCIVKHYIDKKTDTDPMKERQIKKTEKLYRKRFLR